MKQSLHSLVFTCIAALVLTGCRHDGAAPAGSVHGPEAIPVRTATVTNVAWDKTVSIVGTLYPKDEATIGAQVEGSIEATLVDFGDRLTNEQDMAFIDTGSYQARLDQAAGNLTRAEATLANARKNFERITELKKGNIASASDFDQAQAQLDQASAEVKAARGAEAVARLDVERSRVRAPFNCAVSQRMVGRGDFVGIGSPLFHVVNDSVLKFIFQVPERYGSYVQKKLPVTFSVDNYPGETFTGNVYLISPSVSMVTRAFGVGALVTNLDFRLKANTYARGWLVLEQGAPTSVVPVDAVVSFAGVTKVFVIENGVARGRAVSLGRIRDGMQEILKGLAPGESVVVSGQTKLSDGAAIVVQGVESPGRPAKPALAKLETTNTTGHGRR
jgi:membrane fusion protein (multidrug efflux system)